MGCFSFHLTFDVILASALNSTAVLLRSQKEQREALARPGRVTDSRKRTCFLCTTRYFYLFLRNILPWILAIWNKVGKNL